MLMTPNSFPDQGEGMAVQADNSFVELHHESPSAKAVPDTGATQPNPRVILYYVTDII
jgi:hypothetical protein